MKPISAYMEAEGVQSDSDIVAQHEQTLTLVETFKNVITHEFGNIEAEFWMQPGINLGWR